MSIPARLFYLRTPEQLAEAIAKRPALLSDRDDEGRTLLHGYARSLPLMAALFDAAEQHGVELDVNARDDDGQTPLHEARAYPHAAVVLLRRGADPAGVDLDEDVVALWQGRLVTTLEELRQADALEVERAQLHGGLDAFPDELLACAALRELSVRFNGPVVLPEALTALPLRLLRVMSPVTLPESLGRLKTLEELYVQAAELGPAVGELSALRVLELRFGTLAALPSEVGQLASLEVLDIAHTPIAALPESIGELGALRKLVAVATQVSTVPDTLENLHSLEHIWLDGGRFSAVPEVLYRMHGVVRQGMDTVPGFRGWDRPEAGEPPASDAGALFVRGPLREELGENLADFDEWMDEDEHTLSGLLDAIAGIARHAVSLTVSDEPDEDVLGTTRFGGRPDLAGDERPRGQFIAQLDLDELAPLQDYLPRTGLLSFYFDDDRERVGTVVYVEDKDDLTHTSDEEPAYDGYTVRAEAEIALPAGYNDGWIYKGELEPLLDLEEPLVERSGDHQINGYLPTQTSGPHVSAAARHGGLPTDWVILLAVGSEDSSGFHWGSGRDLAYLIHKDALAQADFSTIYVEIGL